MKTQHLKTELYKKTLFTIVIAVILTGLTTSYFLYKSSKENYLYQNERLLTLMNEQASHFLEHPEEELKLVETTLYSTDMETSALQSEVLFILRRFSYIYRVEHLDKFGTIIDSYPENKYVKGLDYSRNPIFTNAKDLETHETVFGGTFIDPVEGHPSMSITMKNRDGSLLVGYLNLSQLKHAFDFEDNPNNIYAIIDNTGHYLLHPDMELVLQRTVDPNFMAIKRGSIPNGSILNYNNMSAIIQYQEIPSTAWYLLVYQNTQIMYAPMFTSLIILTGAIILIGLVTSISIRGILSNMEHTLLNFINMTKNISSGNYDHKRLQYDYIEFQELSANFQQMMSEVEIREEEIHLLNKELEHSYLNTVFLLAKTIEAKDAYTGDHCDRVKKYALMIGRKLNLSKEDLYQLSQGSLLHDIGKLSIPESVLTKAGALTDEEYEQIKQHSQFGYDLIKEIPKHDKAKEIVLYHHERIDGKGYPEGLKSNDIPLLARIVCIADAFDAMMSKRIYRKHTHSLEEAMEELKNHRNTQFDGFLVDLFIDCLTKDQQ